MAKVRYTSLQKVDTGFVFATTHSIVGNPWDWISGAVAAEFDCYADLLDIEEDEDGREFVTESGKRLVEVRNCRMVNAARPLVFSQAAE